MSSKVSGKPTFANNQKKKISILQPGYIPWLGFFEQIANCDVFVVLDNVQFTKNDWRNRNRIKTKNGVHWLTVPVLHNFGQQINEVLIDDKAGWQRKHRQSLQAWYGRSKYFKDYFVEFEKVYSKSWKYVVDVDIEITLLINHLLGIDTMITRSSELGLVSTGRQFRLIEICEKLRADIFYEGKSGKSYMDTDLFMRAGVSVNFQDYEHPYYHQLWMKEQGFISHLSVVDLLFNCGPEALDILTGRKVIEKTEDVAIRHADNA
jgi:hypothetical protein